ncbi:MAG: biotin--[acetyl-CoA-carboxylase] ligase [Candidatus Hydrogenedentes bacterium]|nr:biotin--[acetyl-CoA-carboxylase] ligase [Candidatus Hydrogenedentota bacterium]
MPDTLRTPRPIATPLNTLIVGSRVIVYETTSSTNDCALRLGGEGTVIVAETQTAGRGRHGRSWHSAPGMGLYFSVAFERSIEGLAFAAPLAVRDAVAPFADATVKWPNDVLIGGRKFCGVLIEARQGRTAVGIGINVHHHTEDLPVELRERATSIEAATGAHCDRGELLRDVLTHLDARVIVIRSGGFDRVFSEWAEACGAVGRRVRCARCEGVVETIDRDGALIVGTARGPQRVMLGEIVELEGT